MAKRVHEIVECEGRFSQLREFLYREAIPFVLGDRTTITEKDLESIWELVSDDVVSKGFDYNDPYYNCNSGKDSEGRISKSADCLRRNPNLDHLSLVPLIEAQICLDEGLIAKYSLSLGNNYDLAKNLDVMGKHPDRYLRCVLKKEPKEIVFPGGKSLSGYKVSGNFGIGTISSGGLAGGGVRSDSPFVFEVYQETPGRRGEFNLAAIVGFWAQDDTMLVSQMQPGRSANFPSEVPFGVGCLRIAESVAGKMGFEIVLVYSARTHPIFKQYPDSSDAIKKEFTCVYDSSAKKLGYQGTRCSSYEKFVGNNSHNNPR